MPKNKFVTDYLEFHKKFDFPLPKYPCVPDPEITKTRLQFLLEELRETGLGLGFKLEITNGHGGRDEVKFVKDDKLPVNLVEALDGLVDLQYVVLGTAAYLGMLEDKEERTSFEEAWDYVHKANMQKERVKNEDESKRKTKYDCKKPKGWESPARKIQQMLYERLQKGLRNADN